LAGLINLNPCQLLENLVRETPTLFLSCLILGIGNWELGIVNWELLIGNLLIVNYLFPIEKLPRPRLSRRRNRRRR
jgi:hypothetical protein